MGRIFVVELDGRSYRCKFCRTHLALPEDLVSRAFHCRRGKAYLFNSTVNITVGASEERLMLSGMHTVADIFCCSCGQIVGWKYESAREKSQKYKEGKFVLERYMRYVSLLYIQIPFFFWLGGWHPAGSFIYTVTICVSIYNRGRIVDEIDFSTEVYIDTRPSVSDAEE
ncbi:protein yippee-like [Citrus sinensis]|uniref:Protein yippee-like n=1 Tax=Citrus sinensis TaxID=2711 RepID=A0ACB8NY86_CITSI|nr:protein yippee-like [Citrus sinensis]